MIFQINFYFSIITKIKIKSGKFGPGIPFPLDAVGVMLVICLLMLSFLLWSFLLLSLHALPLIKAPLLFLEQPPTAGVRFHRSHGFRSATMFGDKHEHDGGGPEETTT